jgi:hypothetical protein
VQGVQSTSRDRYEVPQYWLVTASPESLMVSASLSQVFEAQGFVAKAAAHAATDWALLALCATQSTGKALIEASQLEGFERRMVLEAVDAPALSEGPNGPVLVFWTHKHYRANHQFYRHTVTAAADGTVAVVVSKARGFKRR